MVEPARSAISCNAPFVRLFFAVHFSAEDDEQARQNAEDGREGRELAVVQEDGLGQDTTICGRLQHFSAFWSMESARTIHRQAIPP